MSAYAILVSCVAALGGFLFGFNSGVINGTVSALHEAFGASQLGTGFNVASMLLGCAVGAFFSGSLADWLGRRAALLVAAVLFAISAWGSGIATTSGEFIIYRLLGGFAVGGASMIGPAYISEIAPAAYRGRLTSLQQLAIVLGLFTAFLSNFLLARTGGGASGDLWGFQTWQWMFWVELIPVALFFLGLLLIPESPRYLVACGKDAKAAAILARVEPTIDADAKVRDIHKTLNAAHRPSLRDVWDPARKRMHPIIWIGIVLAAFQQLVGINVIFLLRRHAAGVSGYVTSSRCILGFILAVVRGEGEPVHGVFVAAFVRTRRLGQ